MPLTVKAIEQAKSKDKLYRIADAHGLCLEVPVTGSKRWRFRYRYEGKAKMLSLGVWPTVNLPDAREKREEVRKVLRQGIDPAVYLKTQQAMAEGRDSFEAVARDWFDKFKHKLSADTAKRKIRRLDSHVFPLIGTVSIDKIDAPQIRRVLLRLISLDKIHSAHRIRNIIGEIMRYAVSMGLAKYNPCPDLVGVIPPATEKHRASITDPKEIGGLLRAIEEYQGSPLTRCALKLAALTFVRPGELRHAEWSELDFDTKEWRIAASKMKMKRQHFIPLSRQAIETFKELRPITGHGRYVFPSERTKDRAMSKQHHKCRFAPYGLHQR